ncbi:hypothetical protein FO519_009527, partial [Halicephalobus sp. NKZ332]
ILREDIEDSFAEALSIQSMREIRGRSVPRVEGENEILRGDIENDLADILSTQSTGKRQRGRSVPKTRREKEILRGDIENDLADILSIQSMREIRERNVPRVERENKILRGDIENDLADILSIQSMREIRERSVPRGEGENEILRGDIEDDFVEVPPGPSKKRGHPRVYMTEAEKKRHQRESETNEERVLRQEIEKLRQRERRSSQIEDEHVPEQASNANQMISRRNHRDSRIALIDNNFCNPEPYNLGPMNIECIHCGAVFFECEKKKPSPEFDQCCNFGRIKLDLPKCPDLFRSFFEDDTNKAENFRKYNNAFTMTSLSAKIAVSRM